MKKLIISALLAAAIPFAALAADDIPGKGVVKKVDAAAGVVKLAHEPIPAIKWPAMTMDIKVQDARLLTGIKPEQKVNFSLVKGADGQYVISRIEAAK
ncbi:MAG: copper-binding protein [Rhodocyclales bacterium]|nr:copper-binding protein [Rhodocyclales bacterium]